MAGRTRVASAAEDPLRAGGQSVAHDHLSLGRPRAADVRARDSEPALIPPLLDAPERGSGTRMYSGNAGSDNITVFDISRDPTRPREIQAVKLNAPGNPWNFEIDPSGHVIFMLDMRAVAQIPRGRGNDLHALRIGAGGRLTEERSSPVKIPVPIGTNPVGLAVVPARRG